MKPLSIKEKCELLVSDSAFKTKHINDDFFEIAVSDGPVGVRKPTDEYLFGKPQFCLPSVMNLANTWDEKVIYEVGQVLASQCINENVDIILAPGINIKRLPTCGRNFEYFSEDPYVAGKLATAYVNGVQSLGIGTCVKHFCCNNREYDRLYQSSDVDIRTIREIYTKAFEMVINDAAPWSIMCSYNPVNGINVAENEFILKRILREKLHFNNVLVSDWGAVHDRVKALKASLDIQFPEDPSSINKLIEAYHSGIISEAEIDESIDRIRDLCDKIKENKYKRKPLDERKMHDICLNAAIESAILLKNEDNILPLKVNNVSLLGGLCNKPSYCGGGSAQIRLDKPIEPLIDFMQKDMPECNFTFSRMYWYASCITTPANVQMMNLKHGYNCAYDSDVAVFVTGTNDIIETECYDRTSLKLAPEIEEMIIETSKKNNNLVVVIEAGSVIDMSNWINHVKAVLFIGFAGSVTNEAISKILSGKANPNGRLTETFPLSIDDSVAHVKQNGYVDSYNEGVLVGYRWYESKNLDVMFPFGYGLSYSSFKYDNVNLKKIDELNYELSFDVTNTSNVDGADLTQIYISNIDMKVLKPLKELKRFMKVHLKALQRKTITISINKDCFEYYSVCHENWHVDGGRYEIILARNSKEIISKFKIKILDIDDYKKPWER